MTRIAATVTLTLGLSVLGVIPSSASPSTQTPHTVHTAPPPASTPAVPRSMVGRWRAAPDRVPLSDDNAWGRNAIAVRLTELRMDADGTGSITVTRSVVNRAGVAFPGSRIIDTASFTLGAEEHPAGLRPRYATTVRTTSRRYPDPPIVQTEIPGLKLEIYPPADGSNSLEIDFDVFSGDGSFTATLERQRAAAPTR